MLLYSKTVRGVMYCDSHDCQAIRKALSIPPLQPHISATLMDVTARPMLTYSTIIEMLLRSVILMAHTRVITENPTMTLCIYNININNFSFNLDSFKRKLKFYLFNSCFNV